MWGDLLSWRESPHVEKLTRSHLTALLLSRMKRTKGRKNLFSLQGHFKWLVGAKYKSKKYLHEFYRQTCSTQTHGVDFFATTVTWLTTKLIFQFTCQGQLVYIEKSSGFIFCFFFWLKIFKILMFLNIFMIFTLLLVVL